MGLRDWKLNGFEGSGLGFRFWILELEVPQLWARDLLVGYITWMPIRKRAQDHSKTAYASTMKSEVYLCVSRVPKKLHKSRSLYQTKGFEQGCSIQDHIP